jgi:hypothetical protein
MPHRYIISRVHAVRLLVLCWRVGGGGERRRLCEKDQFALVVAPWRGRPCSTTRLALRGSREAAAASAPHTGMA